MSFIFVIAIVFLASYLIRNLYSFSLVKKNNALQERFDKHEWDGLDKDLIKLAQTTAGMANKKNQLMIKIYNNCHMMLAAIAYLSGDKDQFCHWIQHTRDTENFPHIFAVLALYHRAEADAEQAYKCCDKYRACREGREENTWDELVNCFFPVDGTNDINPERATEIAEDHGSELLCALVRENCDILWEDDEDEETPERPEAAEE